MTKTKCLLIGFLVLLLTGCGDLIGVVTKDMTGWDLSSVWKDPEPFIHFAQDNWDQIEAQPGFVEPDPIVLWFLGVDSNEPNDPNDIQ